MLLAPKENNTSINSLLSFCRLFSCCGAKHGFFSSSFGLDVLAVELGGAVV